MRKTPHNRRTDEQIKSALLEALKKEHGTRSALENRINSGREMVLIAIKSLQDEGLVEAYKANVQGRSYTFYCVAGESPKTTRSGPCITDPMQTLEGFREAIHAALMTGIDPFRIVAA